MTWEITWALILGFTLSAVIQAMVRKSTIVRLLGDDRPRTLALATAFGAFEIASTNLVIELGVILALLMGWQFTLAEPRRRPDHPILPHRRARYAAHDGRLARQPRT
jgi:uncharacterized membrane protein YraQ (UPF0718 family)